MTKTSTDREWVHISMEDVLDDPRINDLGNYTDNQGITHVYIADSGVSYELLNGKWTELPQF